MKTTNVLIGIAVTGLAVYGLYRITRKKGGSASTADQKATEIIQMGGADVKSSFMGQARNTVKQTCSEKCSAMGFGVLRDDPCYCKQEKARSNASGNLVAVDGMQEFMHI